jgi:hypothetical protein
MGRRPKGDSSGPLFRVRKVPAAAFVATADDLSAEEIDRIFTQRLQVIRQQKLFRMAELRWRSSLEEV